MTRASAQRGFTLIEVVGAVAIVGIWFLMLSTAAFNGIAAESATQRRIQASLVADEVLADAETQAILGLPVELETDAYGDLDLDGFPEYRVVVSVDPFDPRGAFAPVDPARTNEPFAAPTGATGAAATAASFLGMQRIRIDVYPEREEERDDEADPPIASRITYVLDPATLAALGSVLEEALPQADAEDAGEADDGAVELEEP